MCKIDNDLRAADRFKNLLVSRGVALFDVDIFTLKYGRKPPNAAGHDGDGFALRTQSANNMLPNKPGPADYSDIGPILPARFRRF